MRYIVFYANELVYDIIIRNKVEQNQKGDHIKADGAADRAERMARKLMADEDGLEESKKIAS